MRGEMIMSRPISILVCAAGVALSSLAATGTAGATPKDDGCPTGIPLTPLSIVLPNAANDEFRAFIQAADVNGDGVCYKQLPDAVERFEPVTFLWEENNITTPKGPK